MFSTISSKSLLAGFGCVFMTALITQASPPLKESASKRKGYLPYRKYQPLGAKATGIMVGAAQPVLSTEGRSGPPDQLCFSQDGCSYRWVYVEAQGKPRIRNLKVPVGKGQSTVLYPTLDMASPKTVARWGVKPFTLVEVEVNDGQGSPKNDSFVATDFKVLEGSKEYPLKVAEVIVRLKKDYADYCDRNKKAIENGMKEAQRKPATITKSTGPREKRELMYVTWRNSDNTLQVKFRSKITDGQYYYVEGGAFQPFP